MNHSFTRSDWCEIFVKVDGQPICFEEYPWVVEPLDSMASRIAVRKGAQIGFSILLICRALFDCCVESKAVMIVQPTKADAKDFQSRIVAIIDDLPAEFTDGLNSRDGRIEFPNGGILYVRGSGGKTSLRSVPIDTLLVDEVSAIATIKLSMALSRLDASKSKTFMAVSTPDYPGRGISALYLEGDQRQWEVYCPGCREWKPMIWEDSFTVYAEAPERSFAKCSNCGLPRTADKKWRGRWRPTAAAAKGNESYTVSQLVSRTVSYKEMAEAAIAAHRHPALYRNFVNEKLGIEFLAGDATRLQLWHVKNCVRPYLNATQIPLNGERLTVLGVDQGVQNSYVVERFDFPLGSNRHAIDCAFGTVVAAGTMEEGDFATIRQLQRDFQVWCTVIDRGGSSKVAAQTFCRNSPYFSILAEYLEAPDLTEYVLRDQPSGWGLAKVNRTWAISCYQARVKNKMIALPSDCDEGFYQQLTNLVLDQSGKRYVKCGPEHFGHCCGYAEVGLRVALAKWGSNIVRTKVG